MTRPFYHFTSAHAVEKIRSQGLTRGILPWNLDARGRPTFRKPFQWLTTNPSFSQRWCLLGELPFSRNAYRITVAVPATQIEHLIAWPELVRACNPDSAEELNRNGGDTENWRLFAGSIPPAWFIAIEPNMGERLSALNGQ